MATALILGGGSDIGVAIARKFAEAGFDIQLTARDAESLSPTRSDLAIRYGIQCKAYPFDAQNFQSHEAFFTSLDPKPEVTIYVIGYMGKDDQVLKSVQECRAIIDSNYTGAVSILNLVAAHYAREKKGAIIGISSVAGERGRQSNLIYGSAKAAFSAYLSGLRNWLSSSGVQVLTVKPGFVNTKMTSHLQLPPMLTATPEKVGRAVYRAYRSGKNIIYVKGIWRWIMLLIRNIPESIFKKMKL